jgi:uncharacterized protein (PEP-CTERM system associated)
MVATTAKARGDGPGRLKASSGNRKARRNLTRVLLLTGALPVVLAFPAWAAKWDIGGSLAVEQTYTDNLNLSSNAFKQDDWVTQLIPRLFITGDGPALKFRLNYAPEITAYHARGGNANKVFQRGNADATAELAKQLLFLDAGASVDQNNISLRGPLTNSNTNATRNRATVGTFYVNPYIVRDFGSNVRAEARYKYTLTNSDDPTSSQDSTANRIDLRAASGPAYKLFTWDVAYFRENIDYENVLNPDIDSDVILANARRLITPTVGFLAQGGYENYEYGVLGQSTISDTRWGVGFDWVPSPRTRLAAIAGRRFFDNAYQLDFNHRTRITTWSAGYTEEVTTTRSSFFVPATSSTAGYLDPLYASKFPDPAARQQAVASVISELGIPASLNAPVNFFSTRPFLEKRWRASAGVQGVKNIILANLFTLDRTPLPGPVILPGIAVNEATKQIGTSLAWNLRISARDAWNLDAGYTRNKFTDTGRVDDITTLRMGFRRQFQQKISGSLFYRRQQNDSNRSGFSYTENAVVGTLQLSF